MQKICLDCGMSTDGPCSHPRCPVSPSHTTPPRPAVDELRRLSEYTTQALLEELMLRKAIDPVVGRASLDGRVRRQLEERSRPHEKTVETALHQRALTTVMLALQSNGRHLYNLKIDDAGPDMAPGSLLVEAQLLVVRTDGGEGGN